MYRIIYWLISESVGVPASVYLRWNSVKSEWSQNWHCVCSSCAAHLHIQEHASPSGGFGTSGGRGGKYHRKNHRGGCHGLSHQRQSNLARYHDNFSQQYHRLDSSIFWFWLRDSSHYYIIYFSYYYNYNQPVLKCWCSLYNWCQMKCVFDVKEKTLKPSSVLTCLHSLSSHTAVSSITASFPVEN